MVQKQIKGETGGERSPNIESGFYFKYGDHGNSLKIRCHLSRNLREMKKQGKQMKDAR